MDIGVRTPTTEDRLEFLDERKTLAVISAARGERLERLMEEESRSLAEVMLRHGAILFRGFGLVTAEDFQIAAAVCFKEPLQSYTGGASPRVQVRSGIYESTRVPPQMLIPQHNEMSYMPSPPRRLAFFCEVEPEHGGETPLADSRLIYAQIPQEVRSEFEQKGVCYHRYLYGPRWNLHHRVRNRFVNLYTSWMKAFGTTDRGVVEKFWAENGGTVEWDREEGAKISNVLPAVREHPETGERLWFNHVATFLSSPHSTGWAKWMLYQMAYPNALRRPFHAALGDGTPITHSQIDAIRAAIERSTFRFRWRRGDFLLVDNFLMTHGRMPFLGKRRILVAIDSSTTLG
jgi:alpha-ketoglutarate-dependent taurine dioxygenase